MNPKQSKTELLKRLEAGGNKLTAIRPVEGVAAMLAFYAEQRADGCEIEADGDMLLYQWGIYNWSKDETFQFDLTRQFILPDEDEPFHLSLTFHFEPSVVLRKIEEGNKWCSAPDNVLKFREFIEESAAYRAVINAEPKKVELVFGGC